MEMMAFQNGRGQMVVLDCPRKKGTSHQGPKLGPCSLQSAVKPKMDREQRKASTYDCFFSLKLVTASLVFVSACLQSTIDLKK